MKRTRTKRIEEHRVQNQCNWKQAWEPKVKTIMHRFQQTCMSPFLLCRQGERDLLSSIWMSPVSDKNSTCCDLLQSWDSLSKRQMYNLFTIDSGKGIIPCNLLLNNNNNIIVSSLFAFLFRPSSCKLDGHYSVDPRRRINVTKTISSLINIFRKNAFVTCSCLISIITLTCCIFSGLCAFRTLVLQASKSNLFAKSVRLSFWRQHLKETKSHVMKTVKNSSSTQAKPHKVMES